MDKSLNSDIKIFDHKEQERVDALKRYQILDTAPERSFDNLVKLATQFFNLPISSISFIDTENAFVKAITGVERVSQVPRSSTLCSLALESDDVLVFEDVRNLDPCLFVDAVFIAELGFKFYAGAPIITHDGFRIGTLCIIGSEIREFTLREAELLKSLARIAMDEIELRLTGMAEADLKISSMTKQIQDTFNNQLFIAKAPIAIGVLSGANMVIELANEKILEVWGKTEEVLGKPISVALPELEGQYFLGIMDEVYDTGVPYYGREECATLLRNEVLEDVYFNFVYEPLKDAAGKVINIMIVATEITDQIVAKKALELNEQQLKGDLMEEMNANQALSQTIKELDSANSHIKNIHDELTINYNNLKNVVEELIRKEPRLGDLLG